MNGHSDVTMGALVLNDTELFDRLVFIQTSKYQYTHELVRVNIMSECDPSIVYNNLCEYT